jgi:tRNA(fMet)-specific endonuclease VapC
VTRYLLDTNICIALIRHRNTNVLKRLSTCAPGEAGISVITLAELEFGAEKSARPAQNRIALAAFCAPLEIFPYGESAASAYGAVRAKLESEGQPIGPLDTLIAAHGLSLDAIVVTNNEREFRRITDLNVENWI